MKKIDIIIPVILVITVIMSGVYYVFEWQDEMSEENAMERMAENLNSLDPSLTSCQELYTALDINQSDIMDVALKNKIMELNC